MNNEKTPKDYENASAMDSVFQKSEAETVFQNVITILARTGNIWRDLSFDEYERERRKDGNFTLLEKQYFDKVIDFAHPERIGLFSKGYRQIWKAETV